MDSWAQLLLVNRVLEAAPLLALAAAWVRRRHLPYEFKPVYYYVVGEAFFYFLDRLSRITVHNNIYIYHLSTVFFVLFLSQTYSRLLPPSRMRQAIPALVGLFLVVAVLDATFLSGLFTDLNMYAQALGCFILLALALTHISHLAFTLSFLSLERQPSFFLSVAVLLYCSCSFISYIATTIAYNSGFDLPATLRMDWLFSAIDTFLFAVAMALLAWLFSFYPLSTPPRQALPRWLHYSRWRQRPLRVLNQPLTKHLQSQKLQEC